MPKVTSPIIPVNFKEGCPAQYCICSACKLISQKPRCELSDQFTVCGAKLTSMCLEEG